MERKVAKLLDARILRRLALAAGRDKLFYYPSFPHGMLISFA